jgi:hypothetical protein
MKSLLLILCLFTVGCAGTRIYSPTTGKKLGVFTADMDESEYRGGGVYWKVKGHYPSKTIIARGKAISGVIGKASDGASKFGGGF